MGLNEGSSVGLKMEVLASKQWSLLGTCVGAGDEACASE